MRSRLLSIGGWVLAMSLAAYGCGSDDAERRNASAGDEASVPANDGARVSNSETRVADVVANPSRYVGQTVTVVADVEEVHTPLSFSLDEDAPLDGGVDRELLVLSPKAANLSDIDDQWMNNKVRVTGKVGKMTVVEVEREIGWDLNPELEAELERVSAVLIATNIERLGDTR